MIPNLRRVGGRLLVTGTVLAMAGYLAANLLAPGTGDDVYRYRLWPLYEGVALVGDVIVVLGLPVLLTFAGRAPRLHLAGTAGIAAALVMLNVGEGTTEAFVKPYLVTHGSPASASLPGFAAFEGVALLALVAGAVSLGIGVLRARTLPRSIGVALLVSGLAGAAGLPGAWFLLPDGLFFAALFAVGLIAAGRPADVPARPAAVAADAGGR
jgi:hypothetical protein